MDKKCSICNKIFKVKPSSYKRRKTCSRKCYSQLRSKIYGGKNHPRYKKGVEIKKNGYRHIFCPNHPVVHKGKVAEHRLIMEKHLGR